MKEFPILHYPRCPGWRKSVPYALVKGCENRIIENHSQSLEKLASRGGMSPKEIYVALVDIKWFSKEEKAITELDAMKYLDDYIRDNYE